MHNMQFLTMGDVVFILKGTVLLKINVRNLNAEMLHYRHMLTQNVLHKMYIPSLHMELGDNFSCH